MPKRSPGTRFCLHCTKRIETKHRRWFARFCPGRRCSAAFYVKARKVGREILLRESAAKTKSA